AGLGLLLGWRFWSSWDDDLKARQQLDKDRLSHEVSQQMTAKKKAEAEHEAEAKRVCETAEAFLTAAMQPEGNAQLALTTKAFQERHKEPAGVARVAKRWAYQPR